MSEPASAAGPLPRRLWRRLDPARARFWGVLVPIHVGAFAVLYLGTYQLLERAYTQAGATAARFQLEQAVREMPFLVTGPRPGRSPHVFEHLLAAHQPIGLRLYRADAAPIGSRNVSPDRGEQARVRTFLTGERRPAEVWIEDQDGREWVRGLVRLEADALCAGCHTPGATLGVATMKLDFTDQLAEIRALLRQRVALLLVAWVGLIAVVTLIVQRTVRRSARRLEADLAAATAGQGRVVMPRLPLDPVAAEVHRSLHDFLRRHRERETEVASRLARVDQLASLGQLAAGLAHEIKNPLAGIQGALELLRDETTDESTGRLYREMLDELRRVNGILQRLLESGRPAPLRITRTDLGRLLAETAELLRPSLRRQGVTLTSETAGGLPPVEVDPSKIRQVLVNLIQNAAEALHERSGHVAVRASHFPDERAVVLAVEDDGPGIRPEHLAQLFEPFFTTKFAGTGLGLSISKSLVEQHGGRIEVSSEPGRGTSFLIFLPAGPAPPATLAEPS
jgi:signal transduction histidine kinase